MGREIQEGIKRRGRVCGQQRRPQPWLAGFADGQVLPFVARITETRFPIPRLEIIGDPSHLTSQTDVEELVPVSEFFGPWTGVIDTTKPNTSSDRETISVRKEVWNNRICHGERIKRVGDWHANASGTQPDAGTGDLERIRRKRHCCERCIEE